MHSKLNRRRVGVATVAVFLACLTAAWTSSSQSGSSSSSVGAANSGAGIAAAKAALAPYEGHPSAFPATQSLAKRPAPGSRFVFLQCATPVCAQIAKLLVAPAKALGVTLSVVNSGLTAVSSQAAASTAIAEKPAAVLISAVDPQLFGGALHQLVSAGVAVTGVGIVNGKPYGVEESVGGAASDQLAGKLMADWVAVNKGPKANVVFFGTPQLTFSPLMQASFQSALAQACRSCQASFQQISVLTFGSTAPTAVVSYLQAHPETNTAVFATMEAATGLAAALKDAAIHVTTLGFAPSPSNLQDIKNGGLTAGLGLDTPVMAWTHVNVTARLLAHQKTDPSNLGVDLQFLTQKDVTTADTVNGWTGYPDMAQRFAKLWPSSK